MLIAPNRGRPPEAPEGFVALKGNPFVFRPTMLPCVHRGLKKPDSYCCGRGDRLFCDVIKNVVIHLTCNKCKANPEWIKNHGK